MDEGTGRGSSKQKGLLIPSGGVKSLQISIWWERALGGVERLHPRDFRTQGLKNPDLCPQGDPARLWGVQWVAGAVPGAQSILWLQPQPLLGTGWHWKEKLGKGACRKGWQRGGEDWGAALSEAVEDLKSPEGFCWFKPADDLSCKRYRSGLGKLVGFRQDALWELVCAGQV